MPIDVPPYLAPTSPPPAEGSALEDVLHDMIAGITGLAGPLVRPRWQPEPDNIPEAATAWAAFGIPTRDTTKYPEVTHKSTDPDPMIGGIDTLHQQEELDVLVSFYDLGAGGQADGLCAILRDGLYIAQNREAMFAAAGLELVTTGAAQPVPSLLKQRWLYRADMTFQLRRQIDRVYGIPNIAWAVGTLIGDAAQGQITRNISVTPPSP